MKPKRLKRKKATTSRIGWTIMETTYDKRLVKLGPKQTLLPVVADDATDGFGHALLDGKDHTLAVVVELGIGARIVRVGRRETRMARAGGLLCAAWRIHDEGLVSDRCAGVDGKRPGGRQRLRRSRRWNVVQRRERAGWARRGLRRRVRLRMWLTRCRGRRRGLVVVVVVVALLLLMLLCEVVVVVMRGRV
jgi:hypothetical protein